MVAGPNARYISNRIFNDVGQTCSPRTTSRNGDGRGDSSSITTWDFATRPRPKTHRFRSTRPIRWSRTATRPVLSRSSDAGRARYRRHVAAPADQLAEQLSRRVKRVRRHRGSRRTGCATPMERFCCRPTICPRSVLAERGDGTRDGSHGSARRQPDGRGRGGRRAGQREHRSTAIQTLFAREHNRIVGQLPKTLSGDQKYQIAREVVGAEVQYITYNEFLPALGVRLPKYRGYNSRVNPSISNEFATVGFHAHSMVHGDFDVDFAPGQSSTRNWRRSRPRASK